MIHHAESSYLALLHSLPDAYLAIDGAGCVLEWSPPAEALIGWPASCVVGRSAAELALPESYQQKHPVGLPAFGRVIGRCDNKVPVQHLAINAAGEEFSVELSNVIASDTGAAQRFLVLSKDISHRPIAKERLTQAAKLEAIGQLVTGLAHDFNNILCIILGGLEILEDRLNDPINLEFVKLAVLATERGNELTRAMQAVARRRPSKQECVDINAALRELPPLLQQSASRVVDIMVIAEAPQSEVMIDVGAFNNVMSTASSTLVMRCRRAALPYSRQNINIRADDPLESIDLDLGEYVVLCIDDPGTGMSPEILATRWSLSIQPSPMAPISTFHPPAARHPTASRYEF